MKKYNLIAIYNKEGTKVLLCKRQKNPYQGLFNFVGGLVEENELSLPAAYRELYEETGISNDDVELNHIVDYTYYHESCILEVYYGKLKHSVDLICESQSLHWFLLSENFFDLEKFAGDGNIGHIIKLINCYYQ